MKQEEFTKKTALVCGASGLVGNILIRQLLNDDHYGNVIALVRNPLEIQDNKLTQIITNFDRLQDNSNLIKGNDIFCCLGTTIKEAGSKENFRKVDLEYPVQIAKAALMNGADQFLIITAIGADKESKIFYNRVKGEVEEEIKKLDFTTIHIFRPSLLLGDRRKKRVGEKTGAALLKLFSFALKGKLKKYKGVPAHAVAAAMLKKSRLQLPGIYIHDSDMILKEN